MFSQLIFNFFLLIQLWIPMLLSLQLFLRNKLHCRIKNWLRRLYKLYRIIRVVSIEQNFRKKQEKNDGWRLCRGVFTCNKKANLYSGFPHKMTLVGVLLSFSIWCFNATWNYPNARRVRYLKKLTNGRPANSRKFSAFQIAEETLKCQKSN